MSSIAPAPPAVRALIPALSHALSLALIGQAGFATDAIAQRGKAPRSVPATAPLIATEFDRLHFRSIGPATMSGRISDVAVYEANPAVYYVATAHGGVWKTVNNGTTFTPLFQHEGLISAGDVAISQRNPDLVWVGAGESNNRQSTSWGGGIYKSVDGGKTFTLMGLPHSKHINRVLIHPANDDVVYVAATGPLFGPGGDRGIFKTVDGGRSWKAVLTVDEETGANDVVMSASDPSVLFASTYQRRRTACCMNGGGSGSALWKSTDGGDTWKKVVGGGFPAGALGRITMDIFRQSSQLVYAMVEAPSSAGRRAATEAMEGNAPPASDAPAGGAGANATGVYRSDDGGATWKKMSSTNPRPMYFSQLRVDPVNPDRVYLGGVGLHLSVDGGRTFEPDAALVIHDDIHAIWVNPRSPEHVLIGGDGGLGVSYDLSRTWQYLPNLPVGLFYHVSYDMERPFNVCGGMQDNYDWCGPSAARQNRGIFNHDWFQILGGDGFVALPDLRDSRIIYTESQDGNLVRRNKVTGESRSIRPTPQNVSNATRGEAYRFHWDTPLLFSPHDPGTLLVAANRVFRSRDRGDSWEAISPDLTKNEPRDSIVTMGVKGRDIAIARNDGISQWPAIVALAESPKQAGVFYAGTDDGTVQLSKDDGKTWTNITANIPGFPVGHAFVSEVVPSRFDAATVYVTVDNHRLNDYASYIWVSRDFGTTFRPLTATLRDEVVKTLTEDTRNPDVLYIGTETGIFLTLDRGATWKRLRANFPTVRVDELTIHPRDNALIVATHGRALWILDHLEPIQEYAKAQAVEAALFTPGPALQWKSKDDRNDEFWGHQFFTGENPPTEAVIQVHLATAVRNPMLRIRNAEGAVVRELPFPTARNAAGIQTICWDQRVEPIRDGNGAPSAVASGSTPPRRPIPGYPEPLPTIGYLPENPCAAPGGAGGGPGRFGGGGAQGPLVLPGTYQVSLVVDGTVIETKSLSLIADPLVPMSDAERVAYHSTAMAWHTAHQRGATAAAALTGVWNELRRAAAKLDSTPTVADSVKTAIATLRKELDAVRPRFGVGVAPGAGFGGFGGAGATDANVLARVAAVKANLLAVAEPPSAALVAQGVAALRALESAIADADAVLARTDVLRALWSAAGLSAPATSAPAR